MIEGQEDVAWDEWTVLARACEEHGLEGLFRSDHYSSVFGIEERGSLDAWATLAGLAAVTQRIRLGTMVSPATFRHPSQLAKVVTTVDHISGGRVELGLGAGWHEREHRAYGFEFPDLSTRLERFAEQLEIVSRTWSGDEVDFAGEHYRLEHARPLPLPVQRPRPNLIVGGAAKRGTAVPAVRFADEYNTTFSSPEECARRRKRLDEACERAGRDPATLTFSLMTGVVLGSDRADLLARASRTMEVRGQDGDPEAFLHENRDEMIVGTLDEARERLAEYEAAGVERVLLQHLPHRDLDGVELIAAL